MGPMIFSPNKDETERLLDYEATRRGENKPWHPAARFATGALDTVFVVSAHANLSERKTDAAPRTYPSPNDPLPSKFADAFHHRYR